MTLVVENLSGGYGPITVLREISFKVRTSGILGVLGRNGMGKSTLMKCLSGVIQSTAGTITLGETRIDGLKDYQRARAGLSAVPQDGGIFPDLTVRENLRLGQLFARGSADRTEQILTYFPILRERLRQASGTLSGGERRMLSISRALMTNPSVLLLDEPSEGVMPILVKQIARNLTEINRAEGIEIIVVEQNVPMIRAMADQCLIMVKGQVVAEGSTDEVCTEKTLTRYLTV